MNCKGGQSILLSLCYLQALRVQQIPTVITCYSFEYLAKLIAIVIFQVFHSFTNGRCCFSFDFNGYVLACGDVLQELI